MKPTNCYIPESIFYPEFKKILKTIFSEETGIEYTAIDALQILDSIYSDKPDLVIASNTDALILEDSKLYSPVIRIKFSDNKASIIIHKDLKIYDQKSLSESTVYLYSPDMIFIFHPLIYNLFHRCKKDDLSSDFDFQSSGIAGLTKKIAENKNNIFILPYSIYQEEQELLTDAVEISTFPTAPEFFLMCKNGRKMTCMEKALTTIFDKENVKISGGVIFEKTDTFENSAKDKIHSLLGNDYIKQFKSASFRMQMLSSHEIFFSQQESVNKIARLSSVNKRIMMMYNELKENRDKLSEILKIRTSRSVLLQRDGTILGLTKPFYQDSGYQRNDIIQTPISDILTPELDLTIDNLFEQVNYGLVHSFMVNLAQKNGEKISIKMTFDVIELMDTKLILGTINDQN